jgi:RND family efflux transporter MFP subunit
MKQQIKLLITFVIIMAAILTLENSAFSETFKFTTVMPKFITVTKTSYFFGKVEPVEKVVIKPAISGEIVSIKAKDNEYVKKGDVLFKIGGEILNSKLNMLEKEINHVKEKIKIAEKLFNLKKLSFSKKLIKKDELLSAEMNLKDRQDKLQLLNFKLQNIKRFSIIKSPVNGIFTNRKVSTGEIVNESNELATVISNKKLRISGAIFTDNPIKLLHKKVVIKNFIGKISRILPEKTAEGMTLFYIEGNDLYKYFQIGERLKGRVTLFAKDHVLVIPEDSVVYDENEEAFVFIKKGNKFKKIKVKTGLIYKDFIEVVSGISKTDKIVEKGAYELFYKDFSKTFKVAD